MIKTETFLLPTHWACYFINGDETGYEPDELRDIQHWESICAPGPCLDVADDNDFTWQGDDDNIGADRSTFTFQVIEPHFADGEIIGY